MKDQVKVIRAGLAMTVAGREQADTGESSVISFVHRFIFLMTAVCFDIQYRNVVWLRPLLLRGNEGIDLVCHEF